MIATSEPKTISERIPYGENSRIHPLIRFVLECFAYCDREVLTPTIVLTVVVYAALVAWFCGTVQGRSSLLIPGVTSVCVLTILIFPFACLAGLTYLGSKCHHIYHQCYDGSTRPLQIKTVRIETIERLILVADLEDFGPGYLVRTAHDEYFLVISEGLDQFSHRDAEADDEDWEFVDQLPEILELDMATVSEEIIAIRGSGKMILADQSEKVRLVDLALMELPAFRLYFEDELSAEVMRKLHRA